VIEGGVALEDITPVQDSSQITPITVASIGTSFIEIDIATDPKIIRDSCSVYIPTQIATNGVVLFGLYQCNPDGYFGISSFTVEATDILGNPILTTTTDGATLPTFTAATNSDVITVVLANHGYAVGQTFPVLVSTLLATPQPVELQGNYIIQSIIDANTFTILGGNGSGNATVTLNNGNAIYVYNGLGTTPSTATPIKATDWTLDNFGQDLVACPVGQTAISAGLQ
jgi:hypothetical protein